LSSGRLRLLPASLILSFFLVGLIPLQSLNQVHAQPTQSVNTIVNPGFENNLTSWVPDIYDDGNYNSTITANNTLAHTGAYSARLDVSNNSTAIRLGVKTTLAHITLIQYPPANTLFGGLTNRSDGLSLWFYIQPKFAGFSLIEVRIRAGSTTEMDYIFTNPNIGLGFGNSTNGSEGGKPLKQFILPTPTINQWNQLVRNIKADWTAPLNLPGGATAPGFLLNDTITRFEVDAFFFKDINTGNVYAETAWVDDVAIFHDVISLPSFSFQDETGHPTDSRIASRIFDASGVEANLAAGANITSYAYNLQVYYRGYLILKDPIGPATPSLIQLGIVPTDSSRTGYIATNSLTSNVTITENTESQIAFTITGTGNSLIVADSAIQPTAVVNGPITIPTWTYNASAGILSIATGGVGPFSISYRPVMHLPSITFQDITGSSIGTAINWRITNSQGAQVEPATGTLIPDGAYTLDVDYGGYALYQATITPSLQTPVRLEMLAINSSSGAYIAFNSTVSNISIIENSQNRLAFSSTGTGPTQVFIKVPTKPFSIEKDGATISTWTYNSTSKTVAIQSSTLGTFSLQFVQTPGPSILLLSVIIIAVVAVAISATILWRRRVISKHSSHDALRPSLIQGNGLKSGNYKGKWKPYRDC